MQGWHSQRLLGNGEIADPIIKDKGPLVIKKDKTPKNSGTFSGLLFIRHPLDPLFNHRIM
uniref:Uncharacterized protein n=1 Tax=Arundo donax TaxID=35708 RepID=A0A0A9B0C4_ARUDO